MTPSQQRPEDNPTFGFNVIGYITGSLGLAVPARNTIDMLLANDVPVRAIDVAPTRSVAAKESAFAELIERSAHREPLAVNLFHMNPDQVMYRLNPFSREITLKDRLNVCVPFWELARLPRPWIEPLAAMDLVLAPTRFIRDAILADLPSARVVHYPQAIRLPGGISSDRARWRLPQDAFVAVMSFDLTSEIERKNPWAVITAFKQAFPEDPNAALVVKLNQSSSFAHYSTYVDRLNAFIAEDRRIRLVNETLPYRDVLSLYAASDVLVSLHRAEGLGLSLMEAMALGKPVIGTAWSGNLDFMTEDDSVLVPYSMIPVQASSQPGYRASYIGEGQVWADADVTAAADALRRLATDEPYRRELGARAKAVMERRLVEYASGAMIADVRRVYEEFVSEPQAFADTQRRVRGLRARYPLNYARRVTRAARLRGEAHVRRLLAR